MFDESSFDPPNDSNMVVEDICSWDISTSERTGHITANRTNLKHYYQMLPSLPEVTGKRPETAEEVTDADETGILMDSESPPKTADKRRQKRKRTRVLKENDSVSVFLVSPVLWAYHVSRQRWNSGTSTSVRFS